MIDIDGDGVFQMIPALAEKIAELREEGAPQEKIDDEIEAVYGKAMANYRPFILAFPSLVEKVATDLLPVVTRSKQISNKVRSDPDWRQTVKESREIDAKSRKEALDVYMSAGFKREEAMALLLQDITNQGNQFQHLGKMFDSRKSSTRPTY